MQIIFFWWLCESNAEAKAWGQDLTLFEGRDQSQYVNFRRQHIQEEPALKQECLLRYCAVSSWCRAPESSFPRREVTCGSGVVLGGFSPAGCLQSPAKSLLRNHVGVWHINTLFFFYFLHNLQEGWEFLSRSSPKANLGLFAVDHRPRLRTSFVALHNPGQGRENSALAPWLIISRAGRRCGQHLPPAP